jgi:cytochrome P450
MSYEKRKRNQTGIGSERLPELSDWDRLSYISALMKELLRWACPFPFGIPKRATEDDVYKGYSIPTGATVTENIW